MGGGGRGEGGFISDGVDYRELEEHEQGSKRQGWQHQASVPYEWDIRERRVMTTMTATERALLRSQSGPGRRSTFRHPQSDVGTPDPRDGRRLEIVVGHLFG